MAIKEKVTPPRTQRRLIELQLEELNRWIKTLTEEVNALRSEVDDHETRITALEP